MRGIQQTYGDFITVLGNTDGTSYPATVVQVGDGVGEGAGCLEFTLTDRVLARTFMSDPFQVWVICPAV